MKLGSADFPQLRISLLAALVMITVAGASVYVALNSTRAAKLERAAAQKERNDLGGRLERVRSEEDEIKQKSAVFSTLLQRGVIGEEQRLEWVELLKEIGDRRRLIDLQYEIFPQRSLDTTPAEGFAFYASTMKVQLRLLHEGDLTRLLGDLRQNARAIIQVKACGVSRLGHGGADNGSSAHLQAECQIDWVTLREVAGKKGATP